MYRYTAKIRIAGSVMNEVRKINMSAAEIMILRKLHGDDSIVEIKELANDRSSHEAERAYLRRVYVVTRPTENRTRINFTQMFGPDHVELPARLPDIVRAEAEAKIVPEMTSKTRLKNSFETKADDVSLDNIAG